MSRNFTRRQVLSTGAVLGSIPLSGCSIGGSAGGKHHGATDVVLLNTGTESKTVTITITETSKETPHTSRTLTLDSGETVDPVNDSKLPIKNAQTHYTVTVDVDGGPRESFEWDSPTLDRAPLWVVVDDSENIHFLLKAG